MLLLEVGEGCVVKLKQDPNLDKNIQYLQSTNLTNNSPLSSPQGVQHKNQLVPHDVN